MSVAELKIILKKRGTSASGYLKTSLVKITSAVEKMVLPVDPKFEKGDDPALDELIIHDLLLP